MNTPLSTRERTRRGRRVVALLAAAVAAATAFVALATAPAQALPTNPRLFSCTGSLGEAFTQRTVTGKLTLAATPYDVQVTQTATGIVDSFRPGLAGRRGDSWLHAGYVEWGISVRNPNNDRYRLHLPPVLPGAGGFFDADLEILFAGGANGGWQIPMFDCTVTGGPAYLSTPSGPRSFSCTGDLGEAFTQRTVTGALTSRNRPFAVHVVQAGTGVEESFRTRYAVNGGASWLHPGYVDWDVTGPNPDGNVYRLHVPPVLPKVGGFFDADLEILFAGGANGGWQIPMFDCTVS